MTWTYRGHERTTGRAAPILLRLKGWLADHDSHGRFLGILPSKAHHRANPNSIHEDGRAMDWGPSSDEMGWDIAHTLADFPDGAQVQLILWKDYQWGGKDGPYWKYTGRKDHDDHLHIETRGWA